MKGETGTASDHGVSGVNDSSGIGVYAYSNSGNGVVGLSVTTTVPSVTAGVVGSTSRGGDIGVYGSNTASSGYAEGGYLSSNYGIGLVGVTASSAGGFGAGVYGSGSYYGVWGQPTGGFEGGVGIYGTTNGNGESIGVEAIGTGSGSLALYVNGSGEYTGGWTYESDERLKKDIVEVHNGLNDVLKFRPVTFKWKDPSQHGSYTGTRHGFIAQDVEKIYPEWVHIDREGYRAIDTTGLDAMEVDAIRTLKERNDALEAKNKAQDERIKSQDARIENLETGAHPIAAGFTSGLGASPGNLGLSLLTMIGAYVVSRKKKAEPQV